MVYFYEYLLDQLLNILMYQFGNNDIVLQNSMTNLNPGFYVMCQLLYSKWILTRMPPFVPVQSLYSSCLTAVFEHLLDIVKKPSNTVEHLRKVVLSSLHAGIREHLIHITTAHCRWVCHIFFWRINRHLLLYHYLLHEYIMQAVWINFSAVSKEQVVTCNVGFSIQQNSVQMYTQIMSYGIKLKSLQ